MDTFTISHDVAKLLPQMRVVVVTARYLINREHNAAVNSYVEVGIYMTRNARCSSS